MKDSLRKMGKIVIGFSGGVDSSFLLKVSVDVLGIDNVVAVTIDSLIFSKKEIEDAKLFAENLGVEHIVLSVDFNGIDQLGNNRSNRCYYCKNYIFSIVKEQAEKKDFDFVVDGSNIDDLCDYRPGRRALKKLGVISPLVDAKIAKEEIRKLSKEMGLNTWNKGSFACLASRFPYGIRINKKNLEMVEKAESYLNNLGLRQFRVRYHSDVARIEVEKKDFNLVMENSDSIVNYFKKLGFHYVSLDIEGYRSGSLNEVL